MYLIDPSLKNRALINIHPRLVGAKRLQPLSQSLRIQPSPKLIRDQVMRSEMVLKGVGQEGPLCVLCSQSLLAICLILLRGNSFNYTWCFLLCEKKIKGNTGLI